MSRKGFDRIPDKQKRSERRRRKAITGNPVARNLSNPRYRKQIIEQRSRCDLLDGRRPSPDTIDSEDEY